MNPTKNLNISKLQYLSVAFSFPCSSGESIGQCISGIYTWSLTVVGILAFFQIIYAGVMYLTAAGNASRISQAKSKIWKAILGIIILFSSYLILYTINPDLVGGEFKLPQFTEKTEKVDFNNGDLPDDGAGNEEINDLANLPPKITHPAGGVQELTVRAMDVEMIGVIASDPDPSQTLTYTWEITTDPTGKGKFVNDGPILNATGFGVEQNTPGKGEIVIVRCYVSDGIVTGADRPFAEFRIKIEGYNNPPVVFVEGLLGTATGRLTTGGGIGPDAGKSYDPDPIDGVSFLWFLDAKKGGNYCGVPVGIGMNRSSPSISIPEMTADIDQDLRLEMKAGLHRVVKIVTAYLAPDDTPCLNAPQCNQARIASIRENRKLTEQEQRICGKIK